MKNYFIVLLLALALQNGFGQDKIIKKNKEELNVKIVDQTKKIVEYRMAEYENGSILTMKKNRISKIEYQNGSIDLLGNQNPRKNRPLGFSEGYAFSKNESYSDGHNTSYHREISLFTSTLDYFIIPQVDLDITLGSDTYKWVYFATGWKIHFNSDTNNKAITPFTGFSIGYDKITSPGYDKGFVQIPVGLNYLSKFGFNTSISGNILIYSYIKIPTFFELRIGWKFKV